MKKILYYTVRDMTNPSLGINKKIINQITVLRKHFDVDAVYRKNDSELVLQKQDGTEIVLHSGMRRPYKVEASKWLSTYLLENQYDGCYVRYVYADMQFHRVLKNLKRWNSNVIIEIPTYPYDPELKDSLENGIVLLLDKLYRNRMKKYVNKIATYSKDDVIYDIPTIQIVNGVDFSKISLVQHKEEKNCINILAVADLARWHGYDRLLNGMGEYYSNGGKRAIHFYMVGSGKELELYKEIVDKYGIQDKVTFCGSLYGEELDEIYDKCTIAIECLGIHRKGLQLSSSLKSREYAAKGLPMITSAVIDVFKTGEYPYICKFNGDETPIDMETLVTFHDNIYAGKDSNKVAEEIREYAKNLCDMPIVMKPVVDELN